MAVKFQCRRGTTAQWSAANPILADGEPGFDTTVKQLKWGDGVTAWNSLSYFAQGPTGSPGVPTIKSGMAYFTDGDTVQRVTIADVDVTATSKILVTIRRPDQATEADDQGYLYIANVTYIGTGVFDLLIVCTDVMLDDPVGVNETITIFYSIYA